MFFVLVWYMGMYQMKHTLILFHINTGADVTHSRSFNKNEPSVAAVVASMDQYASTYACEVKMQGHRQEVIQVFLIKLGVIW